MIDRVNQIVNTYKAQGYDLTLRQVYYQFVSRDWLPERWADKETGSTNNQRAYKNLGEIISDGRMGGMIDWNSIEDRTRSLSGNPHWDDPAEIIQSAAAGFRIKKWEDQPYRVEVWVEKDALEGVIGRACDELDIDYFSCRGYTSQTAMWDAARRLQYHVRQGKKIMILHLGDHDPSGIDMSRDIEDRMRLFMGNESSNFDINRIALNMNQIRQYEPPPNPAKITDSRAAGYIEIHGEESWELDALEPSVINELITEEVMLLRDDELWEAAVTKEQEGKDLLNETVNRWDEVTEFLKKDEDE